MKRFMLALLAILFAQSVVKCTDDYDDNISYGSVNNFVWKGLNLYYFWLSDSPDLADDRFDSSSDYDNFINSFNSPEEIFNHLLVAPTIDRYSVIFSDYTVLEEILSGSQKSNGVDYELRFREGSTTELFGWVRYIQPNSDASTKNIQRGDIFYAVNGISLNTSNYINLLNLENYTLNFAEFDNGAITPNGDSVMLTKTNYSENPVYIRKVFVEGTKKIGYLMYNGFYANYETELNNAFGYFQNEGITHLVLDLRYNSGGSINTATRLASMITGQFNNQIFAKQQWNYKIENLINNPEQLLNRFTNSLANGNSINHLNLNKIFILTTKRSASASELVINGLAPYINVVQIGDATAGKNVGSITLYDSPTFRKENVNPNHKYAMQPIVLKIANNNNFSEYTNGLSPNLTQLEDLDNLGTIGEISDPLLNATINYINLNGRFQQSLPEKIFNHFEDSKSMRLFGDEMYLE
ncbi:MAG: S41 family peptidase [Flavobacterium sp.]|uniref:S41 family peptidase n=1 Tax=Flavobacterium sp. TaxID=239 RepID=UPI0025C537A3|nr:S41 family peptidase [Flavobacterium sp.]MCK6607087.1 S41 family peptidase [Flavobacterium sp.]